MNHKNDEQVQLVASKHERSVDAGKGVLARTREHCENQEEFVRRVNDAKMALELSVATFKKSSVDYIEQLAEQLTALRQMRMATDSELRTMLAGLADVRKFFLSDDHDKELARLRDFVEVCERLKALKDSGFLDSVADTILKLESK